LWTELAVVECTEYKLFCAVCTTEHIITVLAVAESRYCIHTILAICPAEYIKSELR
jgi:hypothetical protein